jgi:hypothetical protein
MGATPNERVQERRSCSRGMGVGVGAGGGIAG